MDTTTLVIVVAAAAVAVLALGIVLVAWGRRRAERRLEQSTMRDTFGHEYDRLADDIGHDEAVTTLHERKERIDLSDEGRISPDDRQAFTERWHAVQHDFAFAPRDAVRRADILVTDVMQARSLPIGSIDDRVTAIALTDGDLSRDYRTAHRLFVAIEQAEDDETGLHDLREGLLVFAQVFETMLQRPTSEQGDRVDSQAVELIDA